MKRLPPVLLTLLLLTPICHPADPPKKVGDDPIVLPVNPPTPNPPNTVTSLPAGQLYVIRGSVQATIVASPDKVVKVTAETTPLTIKAIFVDGDGTYQKRTYSDKYLWTVEGLTAGNVELIIVEPDGTTIRQSLAVGGAAPPTPPTPPAPPAPTDPLTTALQTAYSTEADAKKSDKLAALADYYGAVTAAAKGDPTILKLSDLQKKIHDGAEIVAGTGGMPSLRKAISTYVAPKFPTTDQPMSDALWATAATAYSDVSTALKKVK